MYSKTKVICPLCEYYITVVNPERFFCRTCGYHQAIYKKVDDDPGDVFIHYINASQTEIEGLIDEYRGFYEKPTIKEREYTALLCEKLDEQGVTYESPKSCSAGLIDIFIHSDKGFSRPKIIEVKMRSGSHDMKTALGQLLCYSLDYTDAMLFIHCPELIPPVYRRVFRKYGIDIFDIRW